MTKLSGILSGGPARLFAISFCVLFLEMAAIRWLNASAAVLAYFNNLILTGCFFGLGVGCLLARGKKRLIHGYAFILLAFVLVVLFLKHTGIEISYKSDFLFFDSAGVEQGLIKVPLSAVLGFCVNVVFFAVLGQELGIRLQAVENPLRAYAWDIGGSLAGTLAFVVFSYFRTPPHLWFAVGGLLLIWFLPRKTWLILASLLLVAVSCWLVSTTYKGAIWSPYYKVEHSPYKDVKNRKHGHMIAVNHVRIQDVLDFSPELKNTVLWPWIPYYQLPYRIKKPAEKVLCLGAGAGNEVTVALINKSSDVTAVEIDPVIAGLGKTLHPQKPYTQEGVRVFVNDARAFISTTDEKYDLIVMTALDSHRQIAGLSSLRLESFMYTREAFEKIKSLLAPGGVFCLSLASAREWIAYRTFWTLTEAFGEEPLVLRPPSSPSNSLIFVESPDGVLPPAEKLAQANITTVPPFARPDDLLLCTDNWPFLYLETNRIPLFNLLVILAILALSFFCVAVAEPSARRPNFHFFFLGAGFMLLETRSITQLSLLFGSTWNVTAMVICAILAAILVTNHLVLRDRGLSTPVSYALLFLTLAMGYFFPFNALLNLGPVPRLAAASLIVGLPIVWAGFIFSNSFKKTVRVNMVFGSNLLGVVLGAALEYTSSIWGLDALYILAALLYMASLVLMPGRYRETS